MEQPLSLDIPRDWQGTFDPQLIAKYQRRFPGFDDKIVSMYARGMSVREIQGHIREPYGLDVSHDLVSRWLRSINVCDSRNIAARALSTGRSGAERLPDVLSRMAGSP